MLFAGWEVVSKYTIAFHIQQLSLQVTVQRQSANCTSLKPNALIQNSNHWIEVVEYCNTCAIH